MYKETLRNFTFVVMPEITTNVILGCDFMEFCKICPGMLKIMYNKLDGATPRLVSEVKVIRDRSDLSPTQQQVLDGVVNEFKSLSDERLRRTYLENM